MLSRAFTYLFSLTLLTSCAGSSEGGSSTPGPLVDNTQWVPTDAGVELFGPEPDDSECELMPIDCPEYPWPEGECVQFEATSTCVTAYVPECFDVMTVLAVYTRMPDVRFPLCNWLTLEQPSLRAIRAGDRVEVRAFHFTLTSPLGGEARLALAIGDELAFDERVPIEPSRGSQFMDNIWVAPKDYPEGTPLLWHVDNHGTNEYLLIEVNIL